MCTTTIRIIRREHRTFHRGQIKANPYSFHSASEFAILCTRMQSIIRTKVARCMLRSTVNLAVGVTDKLETCRIYASGKRRAGNTKLGWMSCKSDDTRCRLNCSRPRVMFGTILTSSRHWKCRESRYRLASASTTPHHHHHHLTILSAPFDRYATSTATNTR